MTNDDRSDFMDALGSLFDMYGREASPGRLKLYWAAMQPVCTLDEARMAMAVACRTAKFVPTVAELLEHITGKVSDQAELAWGDVQKAVTVSYMADLDFEDRVINAVIRHMGGRQRFFEGFADAESEKWLRHSFVKCYCLLASRELSDEATSVLWGESDRGLVKGRSFTPRLAVIKCQDDRQPLLPARQHDPRIVQGHAVPVARLKQA